MSPPRPESFGALIPGFGREAALAVHQVTDRGGGIRAVRSEEFAHIQWLGPVLGKHVGDAPSKAVGGETLSANEPRDGGAHHAALFGEAGISLNGEIGYMKQHCPESIGDSGQSLWGSVHVVSY